jgi:hypothetical protein
MVAWAQEFPKSELQLRSYEGFKLTDLRIIKINYGKDIIIIIKS